MKDKILGALSTVIDPDLRKDLVSANMIQNLEIQGSQVKFTIVLTTPACPLKNKFLTDCTDAIHNMVDPGLSVQITFDSKVQAEKRANQERLTPVKNLIGVASGKGGVGKSTVAVNIALALSEMGAKVGLLDADMNGPSIPVMLGIQEVKPELKVVGEHNMMVPIEKFGIKIMSIGSLIPLNKPIIWRGPMLSNGLQQLMLDTEWGELDYLIIDLPPGTGDIHITLCQTIPLTATIMVTTPQKVALTDTMKTIEMFRMDNINIPILGVIENMSWFTPKELPENKYYIFGKGAADELSQKYDLPILGRLPLVMGVADYSDKGLPVMVNDDNELLKNEFISAAQKAAQNISILHAGSK